MSVWSDAAVLGLYTLSPTHFGTGQATGAVDLPIARDATTGFPVLPATGVKGVLRDRARTSGAFSVDDVRDLFGPDLDAGDAEHGAGRLIVTEARLVAFPVRTLTRPFHHVTCPLILETLARDLRATGGADRLPLPAPPTEAPSGAVVANRALDGQALVLEDLVYPDAEVAHAAWLAEAAASLATLIPAEEEATRRRFADGLVLVPDGDFAALMASAVPVRARVRLTGGKTTDTWTSPEGKEEKGNLWYEESLPADCLFAVLAGERRRRSGGTGHASLADLVAAWEWFATLQIGGNETVGHGLCLCTALSAASAEAVR